MAGTEGCQSASWSQSQKAGRSPDCSLQLDCMKSESLVIADQHVAVNTFPGLVHTARHTMGVGSTVAGCLLAVSAPSSGKANSHGVTGGVYKARERIHRSVLICDY